MPVSLKPLAHQILVITGASGGVGLATARAAARRGARLVLVARNGDALAQLTAELGADGARVVAVEADVSDPEEARRVAQVAEATFGGFDTWVSTTPTAVGGDAMATPAADQRRLFDALYWGAAYGAIEAARHLRRRGGAIVTVGGALADEALARHAPYGAARGAVEAFVAGLRRELAAEHAPVSVTLVKPSAIGAPDEPSPPLGVQTYDPALVAKAVLHAAEHPRRTLIVGAGGFARVALGGFAPGLARRMAPNAARHRASSYALEAQLHPIATLAVAVGAGLLAAGVAYALGRGAGGGGRIVEANRVIGEPGDRASLRARTLRRWRAEPHPHNSERPRPTTH